MSETTKRYCFYGGYRYEIYEGLKDPTLTLSEYIAYHGDSKFAEWFRLSSDHVRSLRYVKDKPSEKIIRELIDRTPLLRKNCLPPFNRKVTLKRGAKRE